MTFVILSLLALVFAACGNSDSGSSTDPGNGSNQPPPPPSTRQVRAAWLEEFPTVPQVDGQWGAFEGTPINLNGVRVRVEYTDNTRAFITDLRHFTIWPPIYIFYTDLATWPPTYGNVYRTPGFDRHELTFTYGNYSTKFQINNDRTGIAGNMDGAIGWVQPVMNVNHIGQLTKLDYYVDERPQLAGIRVFGEYGDANAANESWHHVELTQHLNLYPWRWVWNNVLGFEDQDPGLLLNVGSWGNMDGTIPNTSGLTGRRIPVRNLWQVETVDWYPEIPNFAGDPLYFDDPTLFGVRADGFHEDNWLKGVLGDYSIRVTYRGRSGTTPGAPRIFPLSEFAIMTWCPWSIYEGGLHQSGLWDIPTLRFFAHVTRQTAENCALAVNATEPDRARTLWRNWLRNADFQRLQIEYREVRTVAVRVPFYEILESIEVENITDQDPIIMQGVRMVDNRMDMQPEFFERVRLTAYYRHNITAELCGGRDIMRAIQLRRARTEIWTNIERPQTDRYGGPLNQSLFNFNNSRAFEQDGETVTVLVYMRTFGPMGGSWQDFDNGFGSPTARVDTTIEVGQLGYPRR
jgi:hypothetical protein